MTVDVPGADPEQDEEMPFDASIAAIRRVRNAGLLASLPVGRYQRPGWPYGVMVACSRGHILDVLWTTAAVDAWLASNPVCSRCARGEEASDER